jgi:hypothetical protein
MSSRNCDDISRLETVPVRSSKRSASVDLPWSMCAMIEKLRMRSVSRPDLLACQAIRGTLWAASVRCKARVRGAA